VISGSLFTRDYLLEGIERTEQWKHLDDKNVAALKQRLMIIANNFLKIAKPNEAETEKDFIYPVLKALGWTEYQAQQILSQKGRKQVPDALLFADTAAKNLAVGEAQQWKRFQHGLAVLEAKRWSRALDRADKKDPSEEGVPSTQMLQYLSRVDVQTNNKVRLGILTNGNVWRLYRIAASSALMHREGPRQLPSLVRTGQIFRRLLRRCSNPSKPSSQVSLKMRGLEIELRATSASSRPQRCSLV